MSDRRWNYEKHGALPYRGQPSGRFAGTLPSLLASQQRDSGAGASSSGSSGSPLTSLPTEMIIAIAEHLDFTSFMSFRHVHVNIFRILSEYQKTAIQNLWYQQLGDLYNEAVGTVRTIALRRQSEITPEALKLCLENNFTHEPDPINTVWDAQMMQDLHGPVEFLVEEIFFNLRNDPWLSIDLVTHPFTATERYRFRRSLYRLELLAKLFGRSVLNGHQPTGNMLGVVAPMAEALFTTAELAEIYSVASVLEQTIGPYHRNPRQVNEWAHAQYILAQGLGRTYRLLSAPPGSSDRHFAIFGYQSQIGQTVCFIGGIFLLLFEGQEGEDPSGLVDDPYALVATVPMLYRDPDTEAAWRAVVQSGDCLSKLGRCASLFDRSRWERLDQDF